MKNLEENGKLIRRRSFMKLLGGGILIFFQPFKLSGLIPTGADAESEAGQQRTLPKDYNAFLHIAEDGTITCYTGKIEMGQGIITSLPVMMADELEVSLQKVKIVMGDTDLCPWDGGTWGSQSTQAFGMSMRAACAEAKAVLIGLASEKLGVPADQQIGRAHV